MRNHHRNKYTIKSIETISARNHIKDHKRQKSVKHPEIWKAVSVLGKSNYKKQRWLATVCVEL